MGYFHHILLQSYTKIMPLTFTTRGSVTKFTLLDTEGEPLDGFCMDCIFPTRNSTGKAIYTNASGVRNALEFVYDRESKGFKAWHVRAPEHKFTMRPIIVGQELVGLDVVFGHIDGFVAHFALDLSTEFEDIVYDVFAPPVFCNEMVAVQF